MRKNTLKLYTDFLDFSRAKIWRKDLPVIGDGGVLGGGTAVAFQLNHRVSYDFDIFYGEEISAKLLKRINKHFGKDKVKSVVDSRDELSVIIGNKVKLTFLYFPFPPLHKPRKTESISLFDLRDLASNKAYAIGRRPAYRDYIDLFFIIKEKLNLDIIIKEADKRFGGNFSEKLFLEQLTYFEDLNVGTVDFIKSAYSQKEIKNFFENQVKGYLSGEKEEK